MNLHSGGNQYGNITLKEKRVVMQNIAGSKVVFDLSLGTEPFPYSHWLTHSPTYSLTYLLTNSPTYSRTHLPTHSPTHLLTHLLLAQLLTYLLTNVFLH